MNYLLQTFLTAFGLKKGESVKTFGCEGEKIIAQEYLRVKNGKRNNDEIFNQIISEMPTVC